MKEFDWTTILAPLTASLVSFVYAVGWCLVSDLKVREVVTVTRRAVGDLLLLAALDGARATVLAALVALGALDLLPWSPETGEAVAVSWIAVGLLSFFVGFRVPPAVSFLEPDRDAGTTEGNHSAGHPEPAAEVSNLAALLYRPSTGIVRSLRRRAVKGITDEVGYARQRRIADESYDLEVRIRLAFGAVVSQNELRSVILQVRAFLAVSGEYLKRSDNVALGEYLELLELDLSQPRDLPDCHSDLVALFERLRHLNLFDLVRNILDSSASQRRLTPRAATT
ncbi:MAG TPA: hypothetical protein VNS19_15785 [Acidimicrobiales bacterium]|nr:hypothetical protein [Acidimicrobiales bacterium]